MLGPLLFILFINDLVDHIPPDANPTFFADDLKIFSDQPSIPLPGDHDKSYSPLLQTSLNIIFEWSLSWQLTISFSKCSVLSICNANQSNIRSYNINSILIPQVSSFCDLGIIVDDKLTFSSHISSITRKAYSQSKLISRCFVSKHSNLLKLAFTSYVRPLLEYDIPIWSPHLLKHITQIENIQRRFTKSIPNLSSLPYHQRLSRLGLDTLLQRRRQFDLSTCYRLYHSLTILPSNLFFTPRSYNATRGHQHVLVMPSAHLDVFKFSFQSRVVGDWNSLPPNVISVGTISAFKARIKRFHLPF